MEKIETAEVALAIEAARADMVVIAREAYLEWLAAPNRYVPVTLKAFYESHGEDIVDALEGELESRLGGTLQHEMFQDEFGVLHIDPEAMAGELQSVPSSRDEKVQLYATLGEWAKNELIENQVTNTNNVNFDTYHDQLTQYNPMELLRSHLEPIIEDDDAIYDEDYAGKADLETCWHDVPVPTSVTA